VKLGKGLSKTDYSYGNLEPQEMTARGRHNTSGERKTLDEKLRGKGKWGPGGSLPYCHEERGKTGQRGGTIATKVPIVSQKKGRRIGIHIDYLTQRGAGSKKKRNEREIKKWAIR